MQDGPAYNQYNLRPSVDDSDNDIYAAQIPRASSRLNALLKEEQFESFRSEIVACPKHRWQTVPRGGTIIFNFIHCSIEQQPHKKTTKNKQIILASVGHIYPTND